MVEIYCGDGKGKTTAAVGLALRAAGREIPVLIFQFLKNGTSGEIKALKQVKGIEFFAPGKFYGFVRDMTVEEKERVKADYASMLSEADSRLGGLSRRAGLSEASVKGVVIMDEALHACNYGLLDEDSLAVFIGKYKKEFEIVLTGRNPSERLIGLADYVSDIQKIKHPYDRGVSARQGIEL